MSTECGLNSRRSRCRCHAAETAIHQRGEWSKPDKMVVCGAMAVNVVGDGKWARSENCELG